MSFSVGMPVNRAEPTRLELLALRLHYELSLSELSSSKLSPCDSSSFGWSCFEPLRFSFLRDPFEHFDSELEMLGARIDQRDSQRARDEVGTHVEATTLLCAATTGA